MSIPKQIVLNGCIIKINFVKNLYRDYNRYGEYSGFDLVINLDEEMCEQKKEVILCHEIVEAIKDMFLLEEMDHEFIQPISVAFYELIKKKQLNFE